MSSNKHVENYNIYERKVMKKNLLHNCKSAQDVQQKKKKKTLAESITCDTLKLLF